MESTFFSDSNAILDLAAISNIGDRSEQQDSFGHSLRNEECLAVVCDGMGGHKGGSLASAIAVERILNAYSETHEVDSALETVKNAFISADKEITALTDDNGCPMAAGTTAVAVIVNRNSMYWLSVGDSRAYLFRDGQSAQLSKDHTYKTVLHEQLEAGLIGINRYKSEIRYGGKLINYIGIGELSLIDYNNTAFSLHRGDKILLATDGLYRYISQDAMARIMMDDLDISSNLSTMIEIVNRTAAQSGKNRDNITAILLSIK